MNKPSKYSKRLTRNGRMVQERHFNKKEMPRELVEIRQVGEKAMTMANTACLEIPVGTTCFDLLVFLDDTRSFDATKMPPHKTAIGLTSFNDFIDWVHDFSEICADTDVKSLMISFDYQLSFENPRHNGHAALQYFLEVFVDRDISEDIAIAVSCHSSDRGKRQMLQHDVTLHSLRPNRKKIEWLDSKIPPLF